MTYSFNAFRMYKMAEKAPHPYLPQLLVAKHQTRVPQWTDFINLSLKLTACNMRKTNLGMIWVFSELCLMKVKEFWEEKRYWLVTCSSARHHIPEGFYLLKKFVSVSFDLCGSAAPRMTPVDKYQSQWGLQNSNF